MTSHTAPLCQCRHCLTALNEGVNLSPEERLPLIGTPMVVCDLCGNKRCPHANNHRFDCTHSNATGQTGSAYP